MPKVTIRPGPVQNLLDYVVKNYNKLEPFCESKEMFVDVQECSKCHRRSYRPGGKPKYECHNFRQVYLIRYLATQVKQTSYLIDKHILSTIKSRPSLMAVSFGGGPGFEAVALMFQLHNCDGTYRLTFDNINREATWEAIYNDLVQVFSKWINNVNINPRFFPLDVTSKLKASKYDVVFLSWILSEIEDQDKLSVLNTAQQFARSAGYIVVTDRPEHNLITTVTRLTGEVADCSLVESRSQLQMNCGLDFPQASHDFGPKFGCNTAYWVLRKS